jgi:hypothetical protein
MNAQNSRFLLVACAALALVAGPQPALAQPAQAAAAAATAIPPDPWPRKVDLANASILLYQPQVNSWVTSSTSAPRSPSSPSVRRNVGVIFARRAPGRQGDAHRRAENLKCKSDFQPCPTGALPTPRSCNPHPPT